MEEFIKLFESQGLIVVSHTTKYIRVRSGQLILVIDAHMLFGLSHDDAMLHVKQRFYEYNVKINSYDPDKLWNKEKVTFTNTTDDKTDDKTDNEFTYLTVDEKKSRIRELLVNKFKLIQ